MLLKFSNSKHYDDSSFIEISFKLLIYDYEVSLGK